MKYTRLGTSGLKVSRICLGMMSYGDPAAEAWYLPEDAAEPIVRRAVDAGVMFFDTADMYSGGASERITGRLLAKFFGQRSDYVLATKVYYPTGPGPNDRGLSRTHVMDAVDASLRRLGTDHIDIYRPARLNPAVPVEETVGALAELVAAGYVGHIGLCAVSPDTLRRAAAVHPISDVQLDYSLMSRRVEDDIMPAARELGIGITARGVLAGGALTWPPTRPPQPVADTPSEGPDVFDTLRGVAAAAGVTVPQVAIAWTLSRGPDIVAVVGARRADELTEALGALRLRLDEDELARLTATVPPDEAAGTPRVPGENSSPEVRSPTVTSSRRRTHPMALTAREAEVLDLLMVGMTNRAVANRLGISERTAREYVGRILLKLGVESRVEAAVMATEWRLTRHWRSRATAGDANRWHHPTGI